MHVPSCRCAQVYFQTPAPDPAAQQRTEELEAANAGLQSDVASLQNQLSVLHGRQQLAVCGVRCGPSCNAAIPGRQGQGRGLSELWALLHPPSSLRRGPWALWGKGPVGLGWRRCVEVGEAFPPPPRRPAYSQPL